MGKILILVLVNQTLFGSLLGCFLRNLSFLFQRQFQSLKSQFLIVMVFQVCFIKKWLNWHYQSLKHLLLILNRSRHEVKGGILTLNTECTCVQLTYCSCVLLRTNCVLLVYYVLPTAYVLLRTPELESSNDLQNSLFNLPNSMTAKHLRFVIKTGQ